MDQGFGLASEAGCKTPFSFSKVDLAQKFLDFADAPDELIPGINYDDMPCPKGKKASKSCKKKNGEADKDRPPSKSKGKDNPTQTNDKPTDKPTQSTNSPAQTTVQSSTSSTTDAGPTPKADCAAIGRNDMRALSELTPSVEGGSMEKRAVGRTLQSRRLEVRSFSPKKGKACGGSRATNVDSKKYPSAKESVMVSRTNIHPTEPRFQSSDTKY